MTPEILRWISAHRPAFAGKVLEVGSRNINGSPRGLFLDADLYWGIDKEPGPGVDEVISAGELFLKDIWPSADPLTDCGRYDTVLCLETLEHDRKAMATVCSLYHFLKPGGHLIVSTPDYGFPVHRYPKDYFRFGTDAYHDIFFAGYNDVLVEQIPGPTICGMGRKP